MKMSAKARYGLRAMIELAVDPDSDTVALGDIAKRLDVSAGYLEQVFSSLRKQGFVIGTKGIRGGYILSGLPSEIKVGDILRALEGPLLITDETKRPDSKTRECIKELVWKRLRGAIESYADSVTLEDMANEYRRLNNAESDMYYI